ncbi:MAG TPA: PH domain-containing protein [Vitreimonas sp.]|nr:PH domain-containing protein [Vitreimonas sp.]
MPDIFDASRRNRGDDTPKKHNPHHGPARDVDEYSQVMKDETPSSNPFHAFAPKPEQIFFDSQLKGERVILLLRQHPITQLPWVLTAVGLALVPILFNVFPFLELLPARYQFAGLLGWYALVFSFILESFLMWFFNVYLITDERIIDVDFYSLIYKNISAAKLDNIEDVSAATVGAVGSIFNYGTIRIQTAGTNTEFEFANVPQPAKVTTLLNELLVEEEQEKLDGRVN